MEGGSYSGLLHCRGSRNPNPPRDHCLTNNRSHLRTRCRRLQKRPCSSPPQMGQRVLGRRIISCAVGECSRDPRFSKYGTVRRTWLFAYSDLGLQILPALSLRENSTILVSTNLPEEIASFNASCRTRVVMVVAAHCGVRDAKVRRAFR